MAESIIWSDRKRHLGLPISFTKYSLSESRVFIESGLLNLKEEEILLYRIRDISLTRSFGQRIFGVGSIHIHSADKTASEATIHNVKNSKAVKELIFQNIENAKNSRKMRPTEIVGDGIDDCEHDGVEM